MLYWCTVVPTKLFNYLPIFPGMSLPLLCTSPSMAHSAPAPVTTRIAAHWQCPCSSNLEPACSNLHEIFVIGACAVLRPRPPWCHTPIGFKGRLSHNLTTCRPLPFRAPMTSGSVSVVLLLLWSLGLGLTEPWEDRCREVADACQGRWAG